jgi:conflict system STAND superfamily ATPase
MGGPVPRQERPLESEETPLLRFAGDLRRLRRHAGAPTYRELGKRTNYSPAALSEAVSGRRLPSLGVTLAFVRACDGDAEEWTGRWRELAAAQAAGDRVTLSPYVGLAAYQVEDRDRFFGREALTATLSALTDERPFVGVFGASGAGKSSLLRAGLAARSSRTVLILSPGADPISELAVAVAGLADEPADRVREDLAADPQALRGWLAKASDDLLLVVDQFEEAFALCDDGARRWLVRALTSAAGPRARVVIGVRTDFYGHCARHPELVAALHKAQVLVGPMSTEELRAAITEPAVRAGASLETALVARLVSDVTGQPAAMPLVSHALAETWHRRRGMVLTLTGYEDAGGIENALARSAEQTFGGLTEDEQAAAKRLFLRLVVPGDGAEDTKRRVSRRELDAPDRLLDRLAAARLVTIDRDSVELAHEALLRAWPRLAGWIDRCRDELRVHRRLTEAAAVWEAEDRGPDALYRGAHLDEAVLLRDRLNPRERAFVDAGLAAGHARSAAERRVTRRLRQLLAGLTALAVALAATAIVAVTAQRSAARQRNEAMSLRVADASRNLLSTRPRDAAALALAAYRVAPTAESHDMLIIAHAAAGSSFLGLGYVTVPGRVAITTEPGAGDTPASQRLWRPDDGSWLPAAALPVGSGFLYLLSADERRAVYWTGSASKLWDISDPDRPRAIAVPPAFPVPDGMDRTGSTLVAVGPDRKAMIWRVGERSVRRLPTGGVQSSAVLPDGSAILVCRRDGEDYSLERWTLGGVRVATLMRSADPVYPYAGPNGLLVTTSDGGDVTVLDATGQQTPRVIAHEGGLGDPAVAAFDPAGRSVAVVGPDEIRLWDTTSGMTLLALHAQGLQLGSPRVDGHQLAVLGPKAAVWRLDSDLPRVLRETCAEPVAVDWDRYFPGVPRRRLCPPRS